MTSKELISLKIDICSREPDYVMSFGDQSISFYFKEMLARDNYHNFFLLKEVCNTLMMSREGLNRFYCPHKSVLDAYIDWLLLSENNQNPSTEPIRL